MERTPACVLAGVAALAVWTAVASVAAQAPLAPATVAWLRAELRLSDADLRDLAAGRGVARTLDATDASEAAAAGAVIIDAPSERLLREFTSIDTATRARGVEALGVFSEPPRPEDLSGLTLTPEELAALRTCRPGNCDVKLPRAVIDQLGRLSWGGGDAPSRATAIVRDWLFAHVMRYRREGHAGLGSLDDKRPPVDLSRELALVLAGEGTLGRTAPAVAASLAGGAPGARPPRGEALYWARVAFGLKPLIRISHVAVHETPGAPGGVSQVVTSTQVYASHYVRAALEVRFVVPQRDGRFLLAMTSRTRNDGMTGLVGLVVRGNVRRRSRDVLARYLETVKSRLEAGARGGIVGDP